MPGGGGSNVRVGVGVHGAKQAASEIDRLRDKFDRLQKTSARGFAIGAGAAITTIGINALSGAAQGAIRWLGEASDAFRADEQSVAQLGAALRANVPDWQKHTKEIDDAIAAGRALAFHDEEQRAGLTKLVGAYGNITKALKAQRLAMDLARYSGMGLLEAEDLLVKVHAGSYRGLKSLGISTKDVKDETQALGLIMQKVGGQAATYALTDLGKVEAANIRLQESQERFGAALSKLGVAVIPAAAGAVEGFITVAEGLGNAIITADDALYHVLHPLEGFNDRTAVGIDHAHDLAGAIDDGLTPSLEDLAPAVDDGVKRLRDMNKALFNAQVLAGGVSGAMDDLTTALYGSKEAAGNLAQAKKDLEELKKAGPDSNSNQDIAIYNGKLAEAQQRVFELAATQARIAGGRAYLDFLLEQRRALGKNNEELATLIDNLILAAKLSGEIVPIMGEGKRHTGAKPAATTTTPTTTPAPTSAGASGGGGGVGGRYSYAAGTDYVPHDMTANLHRGEAVIPAAENRRGGTTIINISGADVSSPERIRDVIRRGQFIVNGTPWATGGPWA